MISVQILEENDTILPTDWCRPLTLCTMSGGMSDSMSFKSQYGGTPENNVKWVLVKHQFGKCWDGQTVKAITEKLGLYEFLRGTLPRSNQLDMAEYQKAR